MSSHICPFCDKEYSRHDAQKRHALRCKKRRSRPLPYADVTRGRKRHACDRCSQKKIHCNGLNPCTACAIKGVSCRNSSGPTAMGSTDDVTGQNLESRTAEPRLTAFLLRDRDEDIFSLFKFPKPVRRLSDARSSLNSSDALPRNEASAQLPEDDTWLASQLEFDIFDSFFTWEPQAVDGLGWDAGGIFTPPDEDPFGVLQEADRLEGLAETILGSSDDMGRTKEHTEDALSTLRYLFSPAQATQSLLLYFEYWHRNCRIIHRPSFSVCSSTDELLIAMILLGAMYNPREEERERAAGVIDMVDEFICERLARTLDDSRTKGDEPRIELESYTVEDDDRKFHTLQAAFLIVVTQYWTGSAESKRKAATAGFDVVTKAVRQQGLLNASHTQEDRRSQADWLRNECRIRTSVWVVLLDCAFLFFWGRPLRIASSEIECDLPCEEAVFDEPDPFTHPKFCFRRDLTSRMAFRGLLTGARTPPNELDVTMLDTFILIHLLYRFASDSLNIQLSLMRDQSTTLPYNDMFIDLNLALNNWHELWTHLKSEASRTSSWEMLGFFKYGDQYEYVIRLLISGRARPHLRSLLGLNCNRLDRLKALLNS